MSWGNCRTCFRVCWLGVQCTKCRYMAGTKGIVFWVYCKGHKCYIDGVFLELILCPTMRGSLDILSHDVSIRPDVKDEDESSRFICQKGAFQFLKDLGHLKYGVQNKNKIFMNLIRDDMSWMSEHQEVLYLLLQLSVL